MARLANSDASSHGGGGSEVSSISLASARKQDGLQQQQQRQQSSPTNVSLTVNVHSPPVSPDQSLSSSASTIPNTTVISKKDLKRSRRRRKANKSIRGNNNIEPVHRNTNSNNDNNNCSSSTLNAPRNHHNNNNNTSYSEYQPSPQQQKKHQKGSSSSFRSPIVSLRNTRNQHHRNNNNNNNNSHYHHPQTSSSSSSSPYNNNNRNHHHTYNHSPHHSSSNNYSSPRNFKSNSSPACSASTGFPTSKKHHDAPMKRRDLYYSLNVEKVAIAPSLGGNEQQTDNNIEQQKQQAPARVTLVNWENEVVLDTFVVVPVPVTDFFDTCIRPKDLQPAPAPTTTDNRDKATAPNVDASLSPSSSSSIHSFADVRSQIERILKGKILIGYVLDDALHGLGLTHPKSDMRDCSTYFSSSPSSFSLSLEEIGQKVLNRPMTSVKAAATAPESSTATLASSTDDTMVTMMMSLTADDGISRRPIQNCVTTLDLYKKNRKEWEETLIGEARERERKQQDHLTMISRQRQQVQQEQVQQQQQQQQLYRESLTTVSLHCDLVQTVLSGRTKTLARVIVVDGPTRNVLMDEFAQIPVPVTDFCDTGINAKDVKVVNSSGTNRNNSQNINSIVSNCAKPLPVLRVQVERLLRGRLVVGYKVEDDLKALGLVYPWTHIRDTAYFPPFLREKFVGGSRVVTVRSLDEMSEEFLRHRLTPSGDRSRSIDLCRTVLYLYETFRDQWERQQQETYHLQQQQQQQLQGRMIPPPSPSSVSASSPQQSPHHQQYQYYGQPQQHQPVITSYGASPTVMSPPPRQEQQKQQQASIPVLDHPDSESRTNSSSWFTWGKQHQQPQVEQNHLAAASASPMLSFQAFQFLQEDPANEQLSSSSKNSFLQKDNGSCSSYFSSSLYAEETTTDSRYEGSIVSGDDSRKSGADNLETFARTSVVSSLRDDTSSVVSSDRASSNIAGSPPLTKNGTSSSSSSSWFRFGSKKSKCSSANENKNNCESMAAVQESEVLMTSDILPSPIALFSSPEENNDDVILESLQLPSSNEEEQQNSPPAEPPVSSSSPTVPSRSFFRFRRSSANSPVRKERSQSPPSELKLEANLEDLSIAAQPEVSDEAGTEAIEITLSIPPSADNEDSISPLAGKSTMRSRSSWLGFRRSSKSSSSKNNVSCNADSLTKGSAALSLTKGSVPSLVPSTTERTAAMDEDWLQEVMSLSTAGGDTGDMTPWLPESEQKNLKIVSVEKSSSNSRGQSSPWFAFKRSKATSSNIKTSRLIIASDSEDEAGIIEGQDGNTWKNQQPSVASWLPGAPITSFLGSTEQQSDPNTIIINTNNENISDVFRNRIRLETESTIPSIATEEPLEGDEYSDSEGYAKEFASGAAQSFNYLEI